MIIKAYAKLNLILNVLGTRPDGYHEVETLMQALSLCDLVSVELCKEEGPQGHTLCAADFEFGEKDLAFRAALLMAETFRKELLADGAPGVRGLRVHTEKHIPKAAGLGGGSADAAAVITGLARLWGIDRETGSTEELIRLLGGPGAKLGSDVPFCIAAQLGKTAAIGRGTGTELEFVEAEELPVSLFFADKSIPDKTRAVYKELKASDCSPVYSIEDFLSEKSPEEKMRLCGNHLQPAAKRLFSRQGIELPKEKGLVLCGAGPAFFSLGRGPFMTLASE